MSLRVRVRAPALAGKNLTLKITLVQEGVAWFMSKGAKTLDIPATVK